MIAVQTVSLFLEGLLMKTIGIGKVTYTTVQKSPSESQAIKKGWSWPGFLFSWIWALAKRQWGLVGLCWVWMILILAVGKLSGATAASWSGIVIGLFLILVPGLLVGAFGNQWLLETLCGLGYRIVTEDEAPSESVSHQHANKSAAG